MPSFAKALLALQERTKFDQNEYMSLKPLAVPDKIAKWSKELSRASLKPAKEAPAMASPGVELPTSDRTIHRVLREMGTAHIFSSVCLANLQAQVCLCVDADVPVVSCEETGVQRVCCF